MTKYSHMNGRPAFNKFASQLGPSVEGKSKEAHNKNTRCLKDHKFSLSQN